jgi:hypothetical protein
MRGLFARVWIVGLLAVLLSCSGGGYDFSKFSSHQGEGGHDASALDAAAAGQGGGDSSVSSAGAAGEGGNGSVQASGGELEAGAPGAAGGASGTGIADPLEGSWHQTSIYCSYTHVFDGSGRYTITSTGGEFIEATYTVTPPVTSEDRWRLDFEVLSDNNVSDCEADRIDETGNRITAFFEIDGEILSFYHTPTDADAAFTCERE